jgi:hypothetical protein
MAEPNTSTEFDPHAYIAAMRKAGMPGALPAHILCREPQRYERRISARVPQLLVS